MNWKIIFLVLGILIIPSVSASFEFQGGFVFYLDNLTVEFANNVTIDDWDAKNNFVNFSNVSASSGYDLSTIISLQSNGTVNMTIYNLVPREWFNFTLMNYTAGIVANLTLGEWGANENIQEYRDGTLNQTVVANASGYYVITEWGFPSSQNFEFITPPYQVDMNNPVGNYNSSTTNVNFNWTCYNYATNITTDLYVDGLINVSSITTNNATPTNYTVLVEEGAHNWSVTCYNSANKTRASTTRNFTVDLTAPATIENITNATTKGTAFTLNADITDALTGVENATGNLTFGGALLRTFTMIKGVGNTWSSSQAAIDVEGNYIGWITAHDFVGNKREVSFVLSIPVGAITPGGGGGGGGGSGIPPQWCPKLGMYVSFVDYTDELCLEESVAEIIKVKEAKIVYFGQVGTNKYLCQVVFGMNDGCRAKTLLINKTTYVLGGVYSTVGVVEFRDYVWRIEGEGIINGYDGPEFEFMAYWPGNFTIYLEVKDSLNRTYLANWSFAVVEEEADITEGVPQVEPPGVQKKEPLWDWLWNKFVGYDIGGRIVAFLGGVWELAVSNRWFLAFVVTFLGIGVILWKEFL